MIIKDVAILQRHCAGGFGEDVGVGAVEEEDHGTTHLEADGSELAKGGQGLVGRLDWVVSCDSLVRVEVCPVHFSGSQGAYGLVVAVEFVLSLAFEAGALFGRHIADVHI